MCYCSRYSCFFTLKVIATVSDKSKNLFRLRPLERADVETVAPWFQNIEDLALFDRTSRVPQNRLQTEDSWKDAFTSEGSGCKCWFIVESEEEEALGMAGLEGISNINRDAVVAMFVHKSARRHGVGIRATAMIVDFAFRQLGLNRLTSYYRADNHSSRDLVSRIGCQVEGTMRQAWFADGEFHDMIVVGILKDDWMQHREVLASELSADTVVEMGASASSNWSWPPRLATGSER